MKPPYVVFDGAQTAIAVSRPAAGQYKLLAFGAGGALVLHTVPDGKWQPVPDYPVGLKIALYKERTGAIMQAREVESLLAKMAADRSLAFNLTMFDKNVLERTMTEKATAAKAAKETKAPVKGQAAAPAKAPAKAAAAPKADKPAAVGRAATAGKKEAAPKAAGKPATKAAAPAKAPAKAKDAGEGRKGRPSSLDVNAKIVKGEHKVSDYVREGSVREALMNAIVASKTVGEALGKTLESGHTVKSVDVHFALEQGYIALK